MSLLSRHAAGSGTARDFTRVNTRRSLVLLAIGAITGIAIAGYGLFTAKGTRVHGVPPEAIALVNQRPILRSDFITQVQTQYSVPFAQTTPAERRKVLDDMIDEEMMVQRGQEVDLPSFDPEVRSALVAGVELQLFADVLAQKPTDAQLQAYYDAHRAKYIRDGEMQVRDLVAAVTAQRPLGDARRDVVGAVMALRQGAALDAVMAQFNLSDSRRLMDSGHIDTGNVFDFAARARLDPAVFAAASVLATGQISDPVVAADGVHVVVMGTRKPPAQRSFLEVSSEVWRDVTDDAKHTVSTNNLRYLRSKNDIQVAAP
ncbi:MAG: peptidyl-prolyl cis-trans isomerase [Steroidobacteraceae bacterium]